MCFLPVKIKCASGVQKPIVKGVFLGMSVFILLKSYLILGTNDAFSPSFPLKSSFLNNFHVTLAPTVSLLRE